MALSDKQNGLREGEAIKKLHVSVVVRRLLVSVTIPLLVVSLVLLSYTLIRNYDYNYNSMLREEQAVLRSVDDHVYSIKRGSMDAVQTMDFLYFSNSSGQEIVTRSAERVLSTLQSNLSVYAEPVGATLYNSQLDRSFRFCFSTSREDQDLITETEWVVPEEHRTEELLPVSTDQGLLLRYTIRERYGSLSVFIRPSDAENYRDLCRSTSGDPLFYAPEEAPVGRAVITAVSEKNPLALSYTIPSRMEFTGINLFQLISILALFFLFVLVFILFRYIQKILLSPLLLISDAFQKVAAGDGSFRIRQNSNIVEINQFYTGFDAMLDSIRDAEEKTMRHQAEAMQAKMQYLQMQIRPHFYLNCLKTINFLAQIHADDKIQSIAISLSEYFRYSFQDVNRLVTVREELHSVGSYVELCRCLYSEIRLELDVPEEAMLIPCLPLSILTFVENCIKHRLDEDEIRIRISASLSGEGDDARLLLRIQNSSLFSEDVIAELNAEPVNAFQYRSDRVGIANVRYRMWLLYQDAFSLSFSNEDHLATVTVQFPVQVPPDRERRLL